MGWPRSDKYGDNCDHTTDQHKAERDKTVADGTTSVIPKPGIANVVFVALIVAFLITLLCDYEIFSTLEAGALWLDYTQGK